MKEILTERQELEKKMNMYADKLRIGKTVKVNLNEMEVLKDFLTDLENEESTFRYMKSIIDSFKNRGYDESHKFILRLLLVNKSNPNSKFVYCSPCNIFDMEICTELSFFGKDIKKAAQDTKESFRGVADTETLLKILNLFSETYLGEDYGVSDYVFYKLKMSDKRTMDLPYVFSVSRDTKLSPRRADI